MRIFKMVLSVLVLSANLALLPECFAFRPILEFANYSTHSGITIKWLGNAKELSQRTLNKIKYSYSIKYTVLKSTNSFDGPYQEIVSQTVSSNKTHLPTIASSNAKIKCLRLRSGTLAQNAKFADPCHTYAYTEPPLAEGKTYYKIKAQMLSNPADPQRGSIVNEQVSDTTTVSLGYMELTPPRLNVSCPTYTNTLAEKNACLKASLHSDWQQLKLDSDFVNRRIPAYNAENQALFANFSAVRISCRMPALSYADQTALTVTPFALPVADFNKEFAGCKENLACENKIMMSYLSRADSKISEKNLALQKSLQLRELLKKSQSECKNFANDTSPPMIEEIISSAQTIVPGQEFSVFVKVTDHETPIEEVSSTGFLRVYWINGSPRFKELYFRRNPLSGYQQSAVLKPEMGPGWYEFKLTADRFLESGTIHLNRIEVVNRKGQKGGITLGFDSETNSWKFYNYIEHSNFRESPSPIGLSLVVNGFTPDLVPPQITAIKFDLPNQPLKPGEMYSIHFKAEDNDGGSGLVDCMSSLDIPLTLDPSNGPGWYLITSRFPYNSKSGTYPMSLSVCDRSGNRSHYTNGVCRYDGIRGCVPPLSDVVQSSLQFSEDRATSLPKFPSLVLENPNNDIQAPEFFESRLDASTYEFDKPFNFYFRAHDDRSGIMYVDMQVIADDAKKSYVWSICSRTKESAPALGPDWYYLSCTIPAGKYATRKFQFRQMTVYDHFWNSVVPRFGLNEHWIEMLDFKKSP